MKKIFISSLFFMLLSITFTFGQLKVGNNGNVAIKPNSTATLLSPLSVGNTGEQNVTATMYRTTSGYDVQAKFAGQYSTNWDYAVLAATTPKGSNFHVGTWAITNTPTANPFGRAFGVLGYAGNSTPGYNYGVFGTVGGSNRGAGIVGSTNGNVDVNVPGTYAGYFAGNVRVTGTITTQSLTNSDSRLKENVLSLSKKDTKFINSIMSMNPVEYNMKQVYVESVGDTVQVQTKLYDEKSQQFQKKHYGLIAQELKEIYPDLVYEEDDDYLTIDYTGLIPILIQSIKELKSEIDDMRNAQLVNDPRISENYNTSGDNSTLLTSYHQDNGSLLTEKNKK